MGVLGSGIQNNPKPTDSMPDSRSGHFAVTYFTASTAVIHLWNPSDLSTSVEQAIIFGLTSSSLWHKYFVEFEDFH